MINLKQPYLRPAIINADILESTYGIIPFAAIGAAAAAAVGAAASAATAITGPVLVGAAAVGAASRVMLEPSYRPIIAAGVAATKAKQQSRPFISSRLPSFIQFANQD